MNSRIMFLLVSSAAAMLVLTVSTSSAQVVINEVVYDSSPNSTRFEEFVELYNAGGSAVDIGGWSLGSFFLNDNSEFFTDDIPGGASIDPGGYYVLGNAATVPNVDLDLTDGVDLWPNQAGADPGVALELRDSSNNLVDAFGYEMNKGSAGITAEQTAQVAGGFWGNVQNYDTEFPISIGRYLDGRDTNNNGRDFGVIPRTPGETNGLTQTPNYTLPDVDGVTPLDPAPGFSASFKRPLAFDPTVADGTFNPSSIPASPQGGNAIIAWDEVGGGNMGFSTELVTEFDIYAYIDTDFYGEGGAESTTYGIGTTGTLHNLPDPTGLFFGDVGTANGNTGIGWVIQKEDSASVNRVMLVDFNDGGPSNPASGDWTVIDEIEMSGMDSDWYRLSIDFDESTGDVTARFDDQTFNFTTSTDLLGTFYVGYRESLSGTPASLRPPTFDLFAEAAGDNADFDDDGDIDGKDFLTWQRNFGVSDGSAQPGDGDANGDGNITQADLAIWEAQFGTTPGNLAAAVTVPEPATWLSLVVLVAIFVMGTWRRRRLVPVRAS